MDADRRLQQKSDRKEKRVVERVEFVTAETPCGVAPHGACNESATQRGVVAGAFVLLTEVVSAAHDTVPEKGVFGSCGQTGDSSPELVAQIEGDAEHMVRAERQVKRASERARVSAGRSALRRRLSHWGRCRPAAVRRSNGRPSRHGAFRGRPHRCRTRRPASVSPRIPDRNGRNGPSAKTLDSGRSDGRSRPPPKGLADGLFRREIPVRRSTRPKVRGNNALRPTGRSASREYKIPPRRKAHWRCRKPYSKVRRTGASGMSFADET